MIFYNATSIAPNGPTVAEFGQGDIIVNVITPGPAGDSPYGVALKNALFPTPPGTDTQQYDGKTIEGLEPGVLMTFTKAASFDTLISRLQLAKEAFLLANPA